MDNEPMLYEHVSCTTQAVKRHSRPSSSLNRQEAFGCFLGVTRLPR